MRSRPLCALVFGSGLWLLATACGEQTGGRWAEGPRQPRGEQVPRPQAAPNRVVMPAPAPAPDAAPASSNVVVGNADAVAVELQFQGVGGLFQGFFADPAVVAKLGTELGPCIEGGLAVVVITWSEQTRIGTITVHAEPEMLRCKAVSAGPAVDLSPLEPIGRALAHYRDGVSGKYDVRIASFRTGLKVLEGMNHCAFWSGGQYPPDGSQWKRCVDLAGNPACMPGDEHEGVTRFQLGGEADRTVRACLGL